MGDNMPAVLNAANEVAVASFLDKKMAFTAIPAMIEHVMKNVQQQTMNSLNDILNVDHNAREIAKDWLAASQ